MLRYLAATLFILTLDALAAPPAPPGTSPTSSAEAALAEARDALDSWSGDPEPLRRAKAILDRLLQDNPADYRALKERARLTMMSGYINERNKSYRGHSYQVGNYRPGTLDAAEAILMQALRIEPKFAEGYVLLGYVLTEQERIQDAAAALRKAEELGTDDPWLHLNWAGLHEARAETAAARERWQKVLDSRTTNVKALAAASEFLTAQYAREGKDDLAVDVYRKTIARDPGNAWNHGNLASFLCTRGRYDEAIAEARIALRIMDYGAARQTLTMCLYNRWGELVAARNPEAAQPYFDEAYAMQPDLDRLMVSVAPYSKSQPLVRALVERKQVSIDARDHDGSTSLLIAVNRNNVESVKFLLAQGANPNVSDRNGWTPLLSAADEGNEENVRMLLAAGADRNAKMGGRTAEGMAAAKGRARLAAMIREYAPPPK